MLSVLRGGPPLRLAEIAAQTGLSRPTVGFAVDQLVEAGWVDYADNGVANPPTPGRPARVVRFRNRAGHVVAVDLGPHKVCVAVADLDGESVATQRRKVRDPADGAMLLDDISRTVDEALAEAEVAHSDVLSVTVGAPGIDSGGVLTQAPSLPGWTSQSLSTELGRLFSCPVHANNDANLAALAEKWRGIATVADTVVFVQWGQRLGAGILIGDRLHRGAHGAAGEIGFITSGESAAPDAEGLGPLECSVSPAALVQLARDPSSGTETGPLCSADSDADAATVFRASAEGDPAASRAIDIIASRFAHGIAPLVLALDPDIIVLGGGISLAGEPLLEAVRTHLTPLTIAPCRIELSALGDQAVLIGAVRFALTDVEDRLLPRPTSHRPRH